MKTTQGLDFRFIILSVVVVGISVLVSWYIPEVGNHMIEKMESKR